MAADSSKLKVTDLRSELKRLGLSQAGLKAELVARLDDALNGLPTNNDDTDAISTPADTIHDQNDEAFDSQTNTLEVDTPEVADLQPPAHPPADSELSSLPHTTAQSSAGPASVSAGASVISAPTEIRQDYQTRHRRSASPPPPKPEVVTVDVLQTDDNDTTMHEPAYADQSDSRGDFEDNAEMDDAPPPATAPAPQDQHDDVHYSDEMERDIEPSVHSATNALYIKNFMRPLRPQEVQDYITELATPPGVAPDETLITDFFLDSVKTHAFIVFATTSAASRVRAALHDRIWPDERNRKPLWIDYIPPERFQGWVSREEGTGGSRASGTRWEVEYTASLNGQVEVELVDAAELQQNQDRQSLMSPPSVDARGPSIPTGPAADAYAGVQGAPTGPRNPGDPRDRFRMNQQAQPSFDRRGPGPSMRPRNDMPETRTYPPVNFKPVSKDLARSRLDVITRAKSNHYDDRHLSGAAKEYRRYYFDDGDMLVDRGPEIFLGIRPPHRERERRREMGRNAGPPGGGYGQRGGGGGGGGRRRPRNGGGRGGGRRDGDFPMYHGIPRGGDRFRPSR